MHSEEDRGGHRTGNISSPRGERVAKERLGLGVFPSKESESLIKTNAELPYFAIHSTIVIRHELANKMKSSDYLLNL